MAIVGLATKTDTQTDIPTYRLEGRRGPFSEKKSYLNTKPSECRDDTMFFLFFERKIHNLSFSTPVRPKS